MNDEDYWKHRYEFLWKNADERVEGIRKLIAEKTNAKTEKVGFGAGTTTFIGGSAAAHGHTKGDADLHVTGTNIFLEVTGPHTRVSPAAPLWVRPDKIECACAQKDKDTWIVHVTPLEKESLLRVIRCDSTLCDRFARNRFREVEPRIRGSREKYVEIPASDDSVKPIDNLYDFISQWNQTSSQ